MKLISVLVAILILAGCTTMKPVEMTADQLHDRISTGSVLNEGDMVKIVTIDGNTHKFRISAITEASIIGEDIEVPIADIVAIETKEFSGGKTALLVAGSYLWVATAALAGVVVGIFN